ncbi:MAG: MoaD/ThiS family protein [Kofleriaceae bacterium]
MAALLIPPILRPYTEGRDRVEVTAATADEALAALRDRFPDAAARLAHALERRYVIVSLGGVDLRELSGGATPLGADDELHLLWAVAGGA